MLLPRLFVLQVALARGIDATKSTSTLNHFGQIAFETFNVFAKMAGEVESSQEERVFLKKCIDDVRLAIRARAAQRIVVLAEAGQ